MRSRTRLALGVAASFVAAIGGPRVAAAVDRSHAAMGELQKATLAHIFDMRQLLRPGQTPTPAIGVNGTVPAPLLRFKEGQRVRLAVSNTLDVESSIHWHGLLVPFPMDGVPGISFPGIKPRSTFVYEFPVVQAGTYWYHSHSGAQEQEGLYGPIVIDPAGPDPVAFDREHMIVLADHSPMHGDAIFRKLKQEAGYWQSLRPSRGGDASEDDGGKAGRRVGDVDAQDD